MVSVNYYRSIIYKCYIGRSIACSIYEKLFLELRLPHVSPQTAVKASIAVCCKMQHAVSSYLLYIHEFDRCHTLFKYRRFKYSPACRFAYIVGWDFDLAWGGVRCCQLLFMFQIRSNSTGSIVFHLEYSITRQLFSKRIKFMIFLIPDRHKYIATLQAMFIHNIHDVQYTIYTIYIYIYIYIYYIYIYIYIYIYMYIHNMHNIHNIYDVHTQLHMITSATK